MPEVSEGHLEIGATHSNCGHAHAEVKGIAIRESGKLKKVSTEPQDEDHA